MQFLAGGCLNSYFRMSSVKNMPDSIFFTSHIYMTLAILCRRRHKVAIIAELNLKFSSRFLRQRDACGMEISVKNEIFHTRDLCLRALDTNSRCVGEVRRNEDFYGFNIKADLGRN